MYHSFSDELVKIALVPTLAGLLADEGARSRGMSPVGRMGTSAVFGGATGALLGAPIAYSLHSPGYAALSGLTGAAKGALASGARQAISQMIDEQNTPGWRAKNKTRRSKRKK